MELQRFQNFLVLAGSSFFMKTFDSRIILRQLIEQAVVVLKRGGMVLGLPEDRPVRFREINSSVNPTFPGRYIGLQGVCTVVSDGRCTHREGNSGNSKSTVVQANLDCSRGGHGEEIDVDMWLRRAQLDNPLRHSQMYTFPCQIQYPIS